jgi:hypothetical protein
MVILAGCTSLPPDREISGNGTVRSGEDLSQEVPAVSASPETVFGDGQDNFGGTPQDAPAGPAIAVSWPAAPGAEEMPRPEEIWELPPEPLAVFPHIIHVAEIEPEAAEEEDFFEETSPLTGSAKPEAAQDGASFTGEEPRERTPRESGISLSSAGESRESEAGAGDSYQPEGNGLSLPGWNTVESREDMVYFVSDRDPHSLILEGSGWTLKSSQGIHTNLERGLQPGITMFTFLLPREGTGQFIFQRQDLSAKVLYFKTVSYRGVKASEDDPDVPDTQDAFTDSSLPEPGGSSMEIPTPEIIDDDSNEVSFGSAGFGEEGIEKPGLDETEQMDTDSLFNEAARYYHGEDYPGLARILEQLQGRDLPYWEQDRLLLFLGRLYDLESPLRDEKAALDYYTRLVEQYPGSLYWEEANRRARYIRRHFFQIR